MKDYKFDPPLNNLYKDHQNLDYIFNPRSVAIIGASEKNLSVGKTLLLNLKNSFQGKFYLINHKRDTVLGDRAYPKISDVDDEIDLAIIATPAKTVPDIIKECEKKGVKGAIIISAGFKELGEPGIKLETLIKEYKGKMRIIGPNCLGIINPSKKLNASFASDMALDGNIAFISQSGALCTAVLDWSLKEKVGFSSFVSIGSTIDVNFGELIYYFGCDPKTKCILIYIESISDPKHFLSAAREVALSKPIILIKAGRTREAAKAAASHTGALAGSDEVLDAAFKRVGILRVDTISELFSVTEVLSKQSLPKGPNLAIITNAGGPGVIATDALVTNNASLAKLSQKSYDKLNAFLPNAWSHNNPVDILGDANADLYAKTIEVLSEDENIDGILTILTPQCMTEPKVVAEKLKAYSKLNKPLLASWMGAKSVEEGIDILTEEGIPNFSYPDDACRSFALMHSYHYNLKGLYETPLSKSELLDSKHMERKQKAEAILKIARDENRTLLDEYESKKLLEAYDIPIVLTFVAKTNKEAVEVAKKIGFPIVVKLYSKTITHKTRVGGVKLNLTSEEDVKNAFDQIFESVKKVAGEKDFDGVTVQKMIKLDAYELILGCSADIEFGPILLFGSGGQLVEVFKDKALSFPPLNNYLARKMIEKTKIYEALKGSCGKKAINLKKLEDILVNFSDLILDFPMIKEFDINPILVSSDKMISLDARVILYKKDEKIIEPAFLMKT